MINSDCLTQRWAHDCYDRRGIPRHPTSAGLITSVVRGGRGGCVGLREPVPAIVGLEVGEMRSSRGCLIGLCMLLLVFSFVALADGSCSVTVQSGESIQAAIDAASDGAVVCLAAGIWVEHITISKNLALRGLGADQSIIKGRPGMVSVILVESTDPAEVTLDELSVVDGYVGITIDGSAQALISNVVVARTVGAGIAAKRDSQITVTSCTVEGGSLHGVVIGDAAQATLVGNQFTGSVQYDLLVFGPPCAGGGSPFQGRISGGSNTIGRLCPADLSFLTTEEGGELDWRE